MVKIQNNFTGRSVKQCKITDTFFGGGLCMVNARAAENYFRIKA